MNKINNKKINMSYGLGILAILALSISIAPIKVSAVAYVNGYTNPSLVKETVETNNPEPSISSINPSSSNRGIGTKTITITGSGFTPSSVARLNGSNRTTTFIDYSHLLVKLGSNDLVNAGTFFITVFNKAPGGGYSNAATLTINGAGSPTADNTNNEYNNVDDSADTFREINENSMQGEEGDNTSNLASNAIFGSTNGFMPSGIIQWVLLAIIILIIVIVVRKIFGGEDRYHQTPLKHA